MKVGQVIKINSKDFTVTKVSHCPVFKGQYELIGTLQGDASFLAGKRSISTQYLVPIKGGFKYNWTAN